MFGCTWPKPATSKLSLLVRIVRGTGSAAARAAAAGEAGEPSDGARSCIGASAVGAGGGGGIHRCGSLRADDCGLIRDRSSAGGVQLRRSTVKRATAPTRETYKGRRPASNFLFGSLRSLLCARAGPRTPDAGGSWPYSMQRTQPGRPP